MVSFSAFWVTVAALGATVLTAWGGYGKNSDVGLSLKRTGPMPAFKVTWLHGYGYMALWQFGYVNIAQSIGLY